MSTDVPSKKINQLPTHFTLHAVVFWTNCSQLATQPRRRGKNSRSGNNLIFRNTSAGGAVEVGEGPRIEMASQVKHVLSWNVGRSWIFVLPLSVAFGNLRATLRLFCLDWGKDFHFSWRRSIITINRMWRNLLHFFLLQSVLLKNMFWRWRLSRLSFVGRKCQKLMVQSV